MTQSTPTPTNTVSITLPRRPSWLKLIEAFAVPLLTVLVFVFFAFFPAGLVLYWTTNGMLSLIQQWIITKRVEAGDAKAVVVAKAK